MLERLTRYHMHDQHQTTHTLVRLLSMMVVFGVYLEMKSVDSWIESATAQTVSSHSGDAEGSTDAQSKDQVLATITLPDGQRLTISAKEFELAWRIQHVVHTEQHDTPTQRRKTLNTLIELKLLSIRAQELEYDHTAQA